MEDRMHVQEVEVQDKHCYHGGSHQLSGAALRRAGRKVNDSRTSCSGACYARQGATRQLLADALITNNLDEEVQ